MLYKILAVFLGIAALVIAVWLGLIVMLVGGIVMLIDGITAEPVEATNIAWGIVRILFAGFVGYGSFTLGVLGAIGLWDHGDDMLARRRDAERAARRAGRFP